MKYTHNPIFDCKWCNATQIEPIVEETPDTPHFAKLICPECNRFIDWMGMPQNKDKRGKSSKFTPESLEIDYCEFCLRPQEMLGRNETLDIHHKMPVEFGGEDTQSNILVLCTYCHKTAHQRHTYLYKHYTVKSIDGPPKKPKIEIEPAFISIPLISGEEHPIYKHEIEEWVATYPAVDIVQQLRNMRQWCLSNPRKKKTARGIRRFITGWLERKQNRGGDPQVSSKPIDDRPVFWPEA